MQKDGVYCKQENGKVVESMQTLQSTVQLNNGIEMPIFGLGVYKSERDTVPAVQAAIKNGYRLIDTAAFYGNEKEVGGFGYSGFRFTR